MQKYQWSLSEKYLTNIKLQCRQTGKSMLTILEFFRDVCYLLPGDTVIICIKQNKKIGDKIKDDLLLELFKGYSNIRDINRLGIKVDTTLRKIMLKNYEIDKELASIVKSKRLVDNQLTYCSLFVEPFEQDINQNWSALLFNGVKLLVIAETSNVSAAIRGSKIAMTYLEEVGEYRTDIYTDIIEPSAIRQSTFDLSPHGKKVRGKLYSVMTLNTKQGKNHFSYKKYVTNQIQNDQVKKQHRFGLDTYTSNSNSSCVVVGDIEKIWQYIPNGESYFNKLQNMRPYKSKVEYTLDSNGEKIHDQTSAIKKNGTTEYFGFEYEIKKTKQKGFGLIEDESSYQRECKMIPTIDSKTFYLTEGNIIKRLFFCEDIGYNKIAGYDDGTEDKRFEIELKVEDRSASCVVQIAMKKNGNGNQYIIYNAYYIKNPSYRNIFNEIKNSVDNRIPIVCENVLFSGKDKNNFGKKESKYDRLLNSVGKNKYHIGYNVDNPRNTFVIKCIKNNIDDRIKQFNEMLIKTKTESGLEYKHPYDDKQNGYQLMICDNCIPLIEYLQFQSFSPKDGKLIKCRDDIWDACWYPIAYYENNKQNMNEKYYKFNYTSKKKINQNKGDENLTPHQKLIRAYQMV